ncbi:MAG: phosphoribosylformylglycinamidine synthase subunit PurS [Candidatus Altiarchaeales archaeon]|nr:phosphoribosylformylglycinamidine synthase subunit PurS [Candidatus Altiarchaeales archaeon]MBD3416676.1 phosphoribosylformylglycinamidine synthase subunit PurS [Candidatus Altiarchaeales archaeon]
MDYTVEVRVELKHGVLDAEGETVQKSLGLLGFNVDKVETVKVYKVMLKADSEEKALKTMKQACEKLLANPVIQDYSVKVV